MTQYLIEFPHTTDNCMEMLDALAQYPELLPMISWGCESGTHNGWAMVSAESEADAFDMLPPSLRDMVRVTRLSKLTVDDIREFHRKAA